MLGSTHIIIGATVAQASGNYPLGLSLAFLSHFIIDAISHSDFEVPEKGNPKIYQYILAFLDSLIAIGVVIYFGYMSLNLDLALLLWGGFFGLIVDLWLHVPIWKKWTRGIWPSLYRFHYDIQHWWVQPNKFIGYGTNLILIIGGIWFLFLNS